jgi:hypothetical protein
MAGPISRARDAPVHVGVGVAQRLGIGQIEIPQRRSLLPASKLGLVRTRLSRGRLSGAASAVALLHEPSAARRGLRLDEHGDDGIDA